MQKQLEEAWNVGKVVYDVWRSKRTRSAGEDTMCSCHGTAIHRSIHSPAFAIHLHRLHKDGTKRNLRCQKHDIAKLIKILPGVPSIQTRPAFILLQHLQLPLPIRLLPLWNLGLNGAS